MLLPSNVLIQSEYFYSKLSNRRHAARQSKEEVQSYKMRPLRTLRDDLGAHNPQPKFINLQKSCFVAKGKKRAPSGAMKMIMSH